MFEVFNKNLTESTESIESENCTDAILTEWKK